jgi:hypothetical protein
MGSDIDGRLIFDAFREAWYNAGYSYLPKASNRWKYFIKDLDIGIVCYDSNDWSPMDRYEIVDEKKWALAKIKYGL